ncbi:MAG: single-stranded-DNA-specific exonuclease RecJ [Vampirovibrio sp.]
MSTALLTDKPTLWQYRGGAPDCVLPPDLLSLVGEQAVLARLLYNRGLEEKTDAERFLKAPDEADLMPVETLPDAEIALNRIESAIEKHEAILIFGDFDVDGITGTSIFYETLHQVLKANVSFYIPDRAHEGHGLNANALLRLASSRQLKLVITTDTGISNFNEVSLLKGLGVDTIVTDHHELPENLPLAVANVNPQRLDDLETNRLGHLSGAGVAYKLCDALLKRRLPERIAQEASHRLRDLCAIGLVADMVPLLGENRLLVQLGLTQLNQRNRLGINALLKHAGVGEDTPLNAESIGFTIGPRLNALGRLENATEGVEFLTTQDPHRAEELSAKLEALNRQRQELCDKTFMEAEQHLNASGGIEGRKAIILASPDWNPGVIGIVASRLIEKYKVPTFMMVVEEAEQKVRCSARSISGFHLTEALEKLKPYFIHMGGHAGAAGFALPLEKLKNFKEDLWKLAEDTLDDEMIRPVVDVDAKIGFDALHVGFVEALDTLAPYGMKNPSPLFVLEDLKVASQRALGANANHLKIMFEPAERQGFVKGQLQHIEALLWKCGSHFKLDASKRYHIACTIEKNTYGMGTPVRLTIKDIKVAGRLGKATESPLALVHETQIHTARSAPPKGVAVMPLTPSPPPSTVSSMRLVDHRTHAHPAEWVSQHLMKEGTNTPPRTLIYNEGRAPRIPFVEAHHLVNRHTVQPCDTLILWDIPPSQSLWEALCQKSQAKTLVVIGAKYQEIDLDLPLNTFLKAVHQGLHLLLTKTPAGLGLSHLSTRFATTEAVMLASLSLFQSTEHRFLIHQEANERQVQLPQSPMDTPLEVDALLSEHENQPVLYLLEDLRQNVTSFRKDCLSRDLKALKTTL